MLKGIPSDFRHFVENIWYYVHGVLVNENTEMLFPIVRWQHDTIQESKNRFFLKYSGICIDISIASTQQIILLQVNIEWAG